MGVEKFVERVGDSVMSIMCTCRAVLVSTHLKGEFVCLCEAAGLQCSGYSSSMGILKALGQGVIIVHSLLGVSWCGFRRLGQPPH